MYLDGLYCLHHLCYGNDRFHGKQAVHMVCYAVHDERLAVRFIDQVADDTHEPRFPRRLDDGLPVFHREDGLEVELVVGVGHTYTGLWIEPMALLDHASGYVVSPFIIDGLKPVVTGWAEATPL